jgi:nitroreductase
MERVAVNNKVRKDRINRFIRVRFWKIQDYNDTKKIKSASERTELFLRFVNHPRYRQITGADQPHSFSPDPPPNHTMQENLTFSALCDRRRSNRKFDRDQPVPDVVVKKCLELATLSPNSSNMQLWEFVWIRSEAMKSRMVPLCMGQQAASSASHMVAFVTRGDLWRSRAKWNLEQVKEPTTEKEERLNKLMRKYYGTLMPLVYGTDTLGISTLFKRALTGVVGIFRPFMRLGLPGDRRVILHKTCALAAQTFMLAITSEGFDTCPMEGFDRNRVGRALGLPRGAEVCMIVAVGKGTEAGIYGKRRRVPIEQVIRKI